MGRVSWVYSTLLPTPRSCEHVLGPVLIIQPAKRNPAMDPGWFTLEVSEDLLCSPASQEFSRRKRSPADFSINNI